MSVTISQLDVERLNAQFEKKSAQELVQWALDEFHPRIALACSFQVEDIVVLDMMVKINPQARVFTLDTGRLHQETYNMMDTVRELFGVTVEVMFPDAKDVEEMVRTHGLNLMYQSVELRKRCCFVRKVKPLRRALSGLDAWVTGLWRGQAITRSDLPKIEIDDANGGILKLNPIADWKGEQIWAYIRERNLPYNALYDQGYASIGCVPCTRPIKPGEDIRAGRWWWESPEHKECGLHIKPK